MASSSPPDAESGPGGDDQAPTSPDAGTPADDTPDAGESAPPRGVSQSARPALSMHSVLHMVEERTGKQSKLLLRDADTEVSGATPIHTTSPDVRRLAGGRGNYQVLGEIARGGMGQVLRGHDTDLGRDVAMKVLLDQHVDSDAILQRFVEEAQIGGQLQHPGIVPVYEMGLLEDQRPFFTMKLVKGRTLGALLADQEDGGRRRLLGIFEQVCQTVAYAHARKVIHRDLKPANIMVGAFGEVQVVDWGLAKVLGEGGVADEPSARQTQVSIIETVRSSGSSAGSASLVGSVMGTPSYMSPEQAQGEVERLDERTDVFALGGILAEILTGRPPYVGEHDKNVVTEAARALQDGVRARLDACGAEPELVDLTKRCLAPSKDGRPRHAGALARDLAAFLSSQEERARAAQLEAAEAAVRAEQERKARRLTLALAATVLVAGLGGGWAWLTVEKERADTVLAGEARRAEISGRVSDILQEAQLLRGQGEFGAALVSLDQADVVLSATADADPGLAPRVAAVRTDIAAEEARRLEDVQRGQRLADFLAHLDSVRATPLDGNPSIRARARSDMYRDAFAAFGLSPIGGDDPLTTQQGILQTGAGHAIASALDHWAGQELELRGFGAESVERLTHLAMAVDPDPWRNRLRRALLADDRDTLERLVASPEARSWPPDTVAMFHGTLETLGHAVDLIELLRAAHLRHPDHFEVAYLLGTEHLARGEHDQALVALTAARGMQPTNTAVVSRMLGCYFALDRFDELLDLLEAHALLTPMEQRETWSVSRICIVLQERGETDRGLELAEYYLALLEATGVPPTNGAWSETLNNISWFLSMHPDPTRRDPDRAVATAEAAMAQGERSVTANTLAMAYYRQGSWSEARDACALSMELAGEPNPWDMLLMAMILERGGRPDEARQWLALFPRGVVGPFPVTLDDIDENPFLELGMTMDNDTALLWREAQELFDLD